MAEFDEALTRYLLAGGGGPSGEELEEDVEDIGPPRIARAMVDLPDTGPLPKVGTAERRRYEAAKRSVERYKTTAGQKRRPGAARIAEMREAVRRLGGTDRLERARKAGLQMAIRALYKVSDRWQGPATMPAAPRYEHVSPGELEPALAAWQRGRMGEASEKLQKAFMGAYWDAKVELDEIEWVRIRP